MIVFGISCGNGLQMSSTPSTDTDYLVKEPTNEKLSKRTAIALHEFVGIRLHQWSAKEDKLSANRQDSHSYSPTNYHGSKNLLKMLVEHNPQLRINFVDSAWVGATVNLGPQTVTVKHRDKLNKLTAWLVCDNCSW